MNFNTHALFGKLNKGEMLLLLLLFFLFRQHLLILSFFIFRCSRKRWSVNYGRGNPPRPYIQHKDCLQ